MVYMATAGLLTYSNKTTAEHAGIPGLLKQLQCSVNMVLIGRLGTKIGKF